MDRKKFGGSAPGELIAIGGGDVAFVPHALPPRDWSFPVELWPLRAEAKRYLGELEGIGSVLPDPTILLRPMADREAIQSSALEGTYATPKELLLFELEPTDVTTKSTKDHDYREVYNYQQALQHGTTSAIPLSLRLMRDLHGILLGGVRGRDKTPGEFRRIRYQDPESGEIYEFLTSEFHLPPGIIAQLYRLRWDIEKFFDVCENLCNYLGPSGTKSSKSGDKGFPEKGVGESIQDVAALFSAGGNVTTVSGKDTRSLERAEATGNLLPDFLHANIPLALIIRKGDNRIEQKGQHAKIKVY